MDNKKDVGKLIKDRLANTEIAPRETLWAEIEKTLDKGQKRRGGFLWLWLVLIISVGCSYIIYQNQIREREMKINRNPNIQIRDTSGESNPEKNHKNNNSSKSNPSQNMTTDNNIANGRSEDQSNSNVKKPSPNTQIGNYLNTKDEGYADKESNRKKTSVATSEKNQTKKGALPDLPQTFAGAGKTTNQIKNTSVHSIHKTDSEKKEVDSSGNIAENHIHGTKQEKDSTQLQKDTLSTLKPKTSARRKRIKKDSTKSQKAKPYILNKHEIFPFANASYYIDLSKSSAIGEELTNNDKTAVLRAGYGIYLVFKIPIEKLNLRLGISHTALQKNTKNVPIAPSDPNTNFYTRVEFRDDISYLSFSNSFIRPEVIILKEQLAYFTVPIDVTYTIWNESKWGVDAIAGLNISILGKNKLTAVREDGSSLLLGSNKNYQKSHFGAHIGGGLYYQFNDMIQMRFESLLEPRFGILESGNGNLPIIINTKLGVMLKF